MTQTNKVVKLYQPSHDIRVEEVPIPTILHPDDAIVRVKLAGLCGSDLHAYRGVEPFSAAFVTGHEFVGEVIALGESYKSVNANAATQDRADLYETLAVGDKIVSPFTSSCAECQWCRLGFTCRCESGLLFGSPKLPGAQAQFIRVPIAGGTLTKVVKDDPNSTLGNLPDSALLLLADIVPTGYFATLQLLNHPNIQPFLSNQPYPHSAPLVAEKLNLFPPTPAPNPKDTPLTLSVVGLGPVGVCSLIALLDFVYPSGKKNQGGINPRIVAVDPHSNRRQRAGEVIAEYWDASLVEFVGPEEVQSVAFNGVLEIVGNLKALTMAYDMIKPFGVICSAGVHNRTTPIPLTGGQFYDKNVALVFGRCPVRALMPLAADLLNRRRDIFAAIGTETALVERIVPISIASEAYQKFDKGEWGKVLFDPWQ